MWAIIIETPSLISWASEPCPGKSNCPWTTSAAGWSHWGPCCKQASGFRLQGAPINFSDRVRFSHFALVGHAAIKHLQGMSGGMSWRPQASGFMLEPSGLRVLPPTFLIKCIFSFCLGGPCCNQASGSTVQGAAINFSD